MHAYVAVTDPNWYKFQKEHNHSEVVFWHRSRIPVGIKPGDYLFFLIKGKIPRIIKGFGMVDRVGAEKIATIWNKYHQQNGSTSLKNLKIRLGKKGNEVVAYYHLKNVKYVEESRIADTSINFDKSIVAGKFLNQAQFDLLREQLDTRDDKDKRIESLETEVMSLKIRVQRIEDMLSDFPNPDDYLRRPTIEPDDKVYRQAIEVVLQGKRASASLLQRRLSLGYAQSARLLDQLEKEGLVGPADGVKPREIYVDKIKEKLKDLC